MIYNLHKVLFFLFCFVFIHSSKAYKDEQHLSVAMRMIGHQVLLNSGDSTSRVLPIENEAGKFFINFEREFAFTPDDLIPTISCIMEDANINNGYIVEVKDNNTNKLIYNYEIGQTGYLDFIPCRLREQPKSDYSIIVTLLDQSTHIPLLTQAENDASQLFSFSSKLNGYLIPILLASTFLLLIGLFLYFKKRKTNSSSESDPNLISIGDSRYDKRNMKLQIAHHNIELTHKEAELLLLLHTSANAPIERDEILKKVWGNEGDYVGRTLDVYVSKLRKKIEPDSSLKIVNIRGIGYKLVVNA